MQPITVYVQTPATERLVTEYGDHLEIMSQADKLSFLRILTEAINSEEMPDPDGTDNAIQAWWLVCEESYINLLHLILAIASIQIECVDLSRLQVDTVIDTPLDDIPF